MEHGEIRVCRVNPYDHTDLSDYWLLPMHDNYNGRIPKILLSHDRKMLLTCGHDGNLFSYLINDDEEYIESSLNPEIPAPALALVCSFFFLSFFLLEKNLYAFGSM